MTNKPAKSNLEKLARSKRTIRVVDLVSVSDVNVILDRVSRLPGLRKVIVLTQSKNGMEIYHNSDPMAVVVSLDVMKTKIINDYLYPDEENEYGRDKC